MSSESVMNQKQEDRIAALEKGQEEILKLLRPISETYTTVSYMGKWIMAIAVFISISLGILIAAKSLFTEVK